MDLSLREHVAGHDVTNHMEEIRGNLWHLDRNWFRCRLQTELDGWICLIWSRGRDFSPSLPDRGPTGIWNFNYSTTYWFLFCFVFLWLLSWIFRLRLHNFPKLNCITESRKTCTNGNNGNDKLDLHGFRHGGGLKAENTLDTRLKLHWVGKKPKALEEWPFLLFNCFCIFLVESRTSFLLSKLWAWLK